MTANSNAQETATPASATTIGAANAGRFQDTFLFGPDLGFAVVPLTAAPAAGLERSPDWESAGPDTMRTPDEPEFEGWEDGPIGSHHPDCSRTCHRPAR